MIDDGGTAFVEAMNKLWNELPESPPDLMWCSRRTFKHLQRVWRSQRPGKSRFVEITETHMAELSMPVPPDADFLWGTHWVDKRKLRRYIRRAAK